MRIGIGIDVYGTLVDPLAMNIELRPLIGDSAEHVAMLWRTKQLEYTFRRAVMRKYANFDICTRQALDFVLESQGNTLSVDEQQILIDKYQHLPPYPDTIPGLQSLLSAKHEPVVFSNGVKATLDELLKNAGIGSYLHGIVSVDDLKTFKPDPRVYHYLAEQLARPIDATWLVSSNSFDVIGAKAAGLKAAWIRRNRLVPFDSWEFKPDMIVHDLMEFSKRLADLS